MLDSILDSCKYVSENSKYVKINYDNVDLLLDELKSFENKHYLSSNPFGLLELPKEDLVNFLLLYGSIDFCFWGEPKWSVKYNDKEIDGAFALLYKMLEFYKSIDNNIFDEINKMSSNELSNIFNGSIEIPLLKERIEILKDISNVVTSKMNSNFYSEIMDINTDIELFDFIINNFKSFKDERTYNGRKIYIYKLAQLLTSDILHLRKYKENIDVDYSNLIGCSDYKIPQVLRSLGILEYNDELSNIVDSKIEIKENDEYEVEIRANTLVVINYLYEKLNYEIDRIDINDFIWLKGKDKNNNKNEKSYHLTRTISY